MGTHTRERISLEAVKRPRRRNVVALVRRLLVRHELVEVVRELLRRGARAELHDELVAVGRVADDTNRVTGPRSHARLVGGREALRRLERLRWKWGETSAREPRAVHRGRLVMGTVGHVHERTPHRSDRLRKQINLGYARVLSRTHLICTAASAAVYLADTDPAPVAWRDLAPAVVLDSTI